MDPFTVIQDILFSSGFIFIGFSLVIASLRNKQYIQKLCVAVIAVFGAMCIAGGWCLQWNYRNSLLNSLVSLAMLLLSPLGSAFILDCFGARRRALSFQRNVNIGSAAVFVAGLVLYAFGVSWTIIFASVYGWLTFTFGSLMLVEWLELRPIRKMPPSLRMFFYLMCANVVLIASMTVSQLFLSYLTLFSAWILQIVSAMSIALLAFRSPEIYHILESAAETIRYERSSLRNVDIVGALERLEGIMSSESVFRDPDLRLETVARRLGMTDYQLSELINQRLGQNFAGYVNGKRIEHARRLLVEQPNLNILTIAFESGFNSKSVFNAAFLKACGVTPTEYRKLNSRASEGV